MSELRRLTKCEIVTCSLVHAEIVNKCEIVHYFVMIMSAGNPFFQFWDSLGIDFTLSVIYRLSYNDHDIPQWIKQ